jgi:signal transduction histidine kinase
MYSRVAFVFIILMGLRSMAQQEPVFSQKFNAIREQKNDSTAIADLKNLVKQPGLSARQQLKINHEIVSRAWSCQKYAIALEASQEGEALAEKNNLDSIRAFFIKTNGITHYFMDRKRECLPFFERAIPIAQAGGAWELEASCNSNIGGALIDLGEHAKAEKHLLIAMKILKDHGKENSFIELRSMRLLARCYSILNRVEKADSIYLSLIEKAQNLKDSSMLCEAMMFYSVNLSKRGEIKRAVELSGKVLDITRKRYKSIDELKAAIDTHASNLYRLGSYKEAFELNRESATLLRKIFAKDLEKEVSVVEVKFKTAQLKKEKQIAELQTKKQQQVYLLSIAGLLLFSASGIFIWNQRKKAKHIVELAEAEKIRFKEVIEAEEKERSRIAQELHDGLGQLLSTARLNVSGLEDAVSQEDQPNVLRSLKIIDEACTEVRNVSHNLMPGALIRLGLIPAINELVNNVNAAKGVQIDFNANIETSIGKSLDITIYRIIQEIVNNMIRHAKANRISIRIEKSKDDLQISMTDDGVGFNTDELKNTKGIGWKNIFSRISMLNGDIKLESEPQKGTMIFINLKLKNG